MCEPTAIIGGALAIGSQVAGHIGQRKAQKANAAAARTEVMAQYKDIAARERQEIASAGQADDDLSSQATALLSHSSVSAVESGVAGGSVDALLADILGQQGQASDDIARNLAGTTAQLQREREGAYNQYQSRLAAVPGPNLLATGIGIAGAGLNAYSQYKLRGRK